MDKPVNDTYQYIADTDTAELALQYLADNPKANLAQVKEEIDIWKESLPNEFRY